MMSLFDVAGFADQEQFIDAHGTATFYGQIMPFNESVRSGPAARRRIIETVPSVSIPTKRVVKEVTSNQVFILAKSSPDWFQGAVISIKYPAQPVERQFTIKTIQQILVGTGGITDVWAMPTYIRRVVSEESSDYLGGYDLIYSAYYNPISPGAIFVGDGQWFRIRETSREDDIGLGTAEAVELYNPLQSLTYYNYGTVYDPETNTSPGLVFTAVQAFVEPLYLHFKHEVLGYVKVEPGDLAISVLKSVVTSLLPNDKIGPYLVLSVESDATVWTAHCRRYH